MNFPDINELYKNWLLGYGNTVYAQCLSGDLTMRKYRATAINGNLESSAQQLFTTANILNSMNQPVAEGWVAEAKYDMGHFVGVWTICMVSTNGNNTGYMYGGGATPKLPVHDDVEFWAVPHPRVNGTVIPNQAASFQMPGFCSYIENFYPVATPTLKWKINFSGWFYAFFTL